jgi:Tfp pilus assembly protein PilX
MIVRQREGFILAAALLALLMIAGLVAAVFFAANEGTRISAASSERERTLAAAESAIEQTVVEWSGADSSIAVGRTSASSRDDGIPVSVYTTRLDSTLFWIVADAGPARVGSGVRARIGALVSAKTTSGGGVAVERISERWWSELF